MTAMPMKGNDLTVRGGVPVAFEVAKALHAPLDVFLVRKLGAPGQQELAPTDDAPSAPSVPPCVPPRVVRGGMH